MNKQDKSMAAVAVAACGVCCATPILGFLSAIGLGTAFGVLRFGLIGLLVVALAIPLLVRRRRQRRSSCVATESVPVEMPKVRSSS
jgi:EamA domain-containing membrane protein RarD